MRFATLTALGAALALVPAAGSLRAQINPATALNSAKAGAQTAQAAGQSSSQKAGTSATTQPKPQPKPQQGTASKSSTAATTKPAPGKTSSSAAAASSNKPAATKPVAAHPKSTYIPANRNKTAANTTKQMDDKPKTVPVAARPTPASPEPAPIEIPKLHSQPLMKVSNVSNRRDPFSSLIGREPHGGVGHDIALPPGKAGLQVESLIIQGLVRGPNGMIAVVENPQQRVYFLHEGDSLFDGKVDRITIEGITFHESGKDAFGKPMERDVTKRLNASLGEQP